MLNILINAYGCSPSKGSEAGLGWMWVSRLARYHNIYVITELESKEELENTLPVFPNNDRLHCYFVDIGERGRRMCWNQGDWRFYYYYKQYQWKVYMLAKGLHEKIHFDIVHQLNMIGYRELGYLWKLQNCSYVWGPIGGFTFVPQSFFWELGLKNAVFYFIKNSLNWLTAKTHRRVKNAAKRADVLLSAQKNSENCIQRFFNKNSILMNETGLDVTPVDNNPNPQNYKNLKIIWVGRMIPTKLLNLAIKSLSLLPDDVKYEFHILGDGPCKTKAKMLAEQLKVGKHCKWYGMISKQQVQKILQSSHLFYFTSIIEGTSHAVMEAIANRLPVLCFDTCGHGKIVNEKIGIKIPLTTPENAKKQFAEIITDLYYHREKLGILSQATDEDIYDLSWDAKISKMLEIYQSCFEGKFVS